MAKKSVIARELKRIRLVKLSGKKREQLKNLIQTECAKESPNYERIEELNTKLSKMPRDSSKCRVQKRCNCCGRPRAVYRRFGLCRICLRNHLLEGDVSGGRKSSW